jgi:DNA-binding response OmpR family regulator
MILLIHDHDTLRALLAGSLRRAGHEVTDVQTGAKGLEVARENLPALVLLDYLLKIEGRTAHDYVPLLREIAPATHVVILTVLTPDDVEDIHIPGVAGWIHVESTPDWLTQAFPDMVARYVR